MKRTLPILFLFVCFHVLAEEPTRITGPLTAEGYIDYHKALEKKTYPPELATDDNGLRVFVRLFGDVGDYHREMTAEDREFFRRQKYEKLGLDPNVPPTLVLPKEPHQFLEDLYKARGEEVPRTLRDAPWTLERFPMLADWFKEIDKPLDAIAETIRKPVFCPPLLQSPESVRSGIPQNLIAVFLPDLQTSRAIGRILQARADNRIALGNIDGAIDDKLTAHRLGRLLPPRGPIVQHLIGIAIEGMAMSIPVGGNPEYPLTEQQIRRILHGLDALPPRTSTTDALEWERHMALSAIQELRIVSEQGTDFGFLEAGGFGPQAPQILNIITNAVSFDWDVVDRRMNEVYDALKKPPPREEFKSIMEEVESIRPGNWQWLARTMLTPDGPARLVANMFIALFVPALDAYEEGVRRSECQENMHRLALAIKLYQLETGKMPDENWAAQIEKYLGRNVERYFSCPSNPSPKGSTTYALIQFGGVVIGSPETLVLIELTEPVPMDKAVVSLDEVFELVPGKRVQEGERVRRISPHPGGMMTTNRSGAVRFLSASTSEAELLRLLGGE
ncbi:MAG: hypothetical protein FWE95_07180 [Planctomycetaceae bacterium]|nr:hypothetical protein [Planctomycetaceae bacterium]